MEEAALLDGVELACGALEAGGGLASKAPGMAGAAFAGRAAALASVWAALAVLVGTPFARGWKVLDAEILV